MKKPGRLSVAKGEQLMRALVIGGANGIGAAIVDYLYEVYNVVPSILDKMGNPNFVTVRTEFPLMGDPPVIHSNKFTHVYITLGLPSHREFDTTDFYKEAELLQGNFQAVTSALRLARHNSFPDASFVVTSTVSSLRADHGGAVYAAAKAALNQLVQNLAREWEPARVNAIAPGPTATNQFLDNVPPDNQEKERWRSPHGRIMAPPDVAQAAVELSRMSAVSGVILPVDLAGVSSSRRVQ